MINFLIKRLTNILIIFFLGLQILIYIFNQKPINDDFSQKTVSVENFSSIVLVNLE